MTPPTTSETRRRRREKIAVVAIFFVLLVFTGVEVHLLRLSAKLPFVNSIFFFGLMNLNIVLIMLLLFLVFRNAVKLLLDERRGRIGSRLKTRLVFCFLLFAIIPTLFLFTISAFYIKNSFDKWFNARVGGTLQRSIEVVKNYYENTEKNASHFARKAALLLDEKDFKKPDVLFKKLQSARLEYGLDALEYYSDPFTDRLLSVHPDRAPLIPSASLETLQKALQGATDCKVQQVGEGELVRCGAYLGVGRGVLFADYFVPMGLASQLSEISLTYEDYKRDNPLNYPIKSTYFAILTMVTLLILFSATWTGFYVAKRLTVPIEELVRGTEAVAHGNLDYTIQSSGSDEMSKLVESFNKMVDDLKQNKLDIEATHASLTHGRRYIEVLLESVQSGVVSLDAAGKVSTMNAAAAELLRVSPQACIGKSHTALVPESHHAEFEEILNAVYGTAHPIRRELKIKTASNDWVSLLVTMSVLRDENKKQIGMVAVFDDVTQIQQMERMMAWREVAKRIAHEIKNPLTPIQLSVQRLQRRYLSKISDDGTFEQATEIILKEVEALRNLVSEFSSFARLPEIRQQPESLNEIALETVNLFRAGHEAIHFDLQFQEDLPTLALDRAQMKRALINLFDNAVAAMNGSGTITVTTEYDRDLQRIAMTVADEGCGISEQVSSQLFEPHFSTKEGGTGLGLAIVQKIVTDHGGFIRVGSNRPAGTRFTIEFGESLIQGFRMRATMLGKKEDAIT
jgi:two-component system, NtrC family, nitrogen regulation sensor histidine kinase NtrY